MPNNVVDALIEIPLGSRNKYELDKATGRIRLDRAGGMSLSELAEKYHLSEKSISRVLRETK